MIGTAWLKQHPFQHRDHIVEAGFLIEKGGSLRTVLLKSSQASVQHFFCIVSSLILDLIWFSVRISIILSFV